MGPLDLRLSGNSVSRKTDSPASTRASREGNARVSTAYFLLFLALVSWASFKAWPEDVAEARAGIGAAVLGHGLLLFGDLHRLDREVRLLRTVEADDHRVEILADLEALRALFVAVAAKIAALDEADRAIVADLNVEPASWTARTMTVTVSPFLTAARGRAPPPRGAGTRAAALELLHAERDALLLDIDVEHLRLDRLTLAVKLERFLARNAPGDVRHVDHAVDVALEPDEQAELGRVLDLALDHEPTG